MDKARRLWIQNVALVSVTGAVLWACGAGGDDEAAADVVAKENPRADGDLLNAALGLEHEAIGLYTAAAKLPIWGAKEVLLIILASFLEHHKAHRDFLIGALAALRAKDATVAAAVAASAEDFYVNAAIAAGASLAAPKGVLRLVAQKEAAATKAYLSSIKAFTIRSLAEYAGLHGGDEAAHYGTLRAALLMIEADAETIATPGDVIPGATPVAFS